MNNKLAQSLLAAMLLPAWTAAGGVWIGGGEDGLWSTPGNWDGQAVPPFPAALSFSGTAGMAPSNDLGEVTLSGIAFPVGAGGFTLVGDAVLLDGDIVNAGTNTQAISLGMELPATRTVTTSSGSIVLGGALSGPGGLVKGNSGNSLYLGSANTFSGPVWIQRDSLYASSLNSVEGGSASSSLGAPASAADGTLTFGTGYRRGDLRYTGTGETTDRILRFQGVGGILLSQEGSGLLRFTSDTARANQGWNHTLRLAGSTDGTGEFAGAIADGTAGGVTSVRKEGAGAWTLSGANTYSGPTEVAAGTLRIGGDNSAATGTVSVAAGAALGGRGIAGGDVHFAGGGRFHFDPSGPLQVAPGRQISFEAFGVDDIAGLGHGTAPGSYALVDGAIDPANLENVGQAQAGIAEGGYVAWLETGGGLTLHIERAFGLLPELDVVRDFGADPLGGNDDAPAFQAAMRVLESAGGGCLRIPVGDYRFDSLVVATGNNTSGARRLTIQGEPGARLLGNNPDGVFRLTYNTRHQQVNIHDLEIVALIEGAGTAIQVTSPPGGAQDKRVVTVTNVAISGPPEGAAYFNKGLVVTGLYRPLIQNCSFRRSTSEDMGDASPNFLPEVGFDVSDCYAPVFQDCTVEGAHTAFSFVTSPDSCPEDGAVRGCKADYCRIGVRFLQTDGAEPTFWTEGCDIRARDIGVWVKRRRICNITGNTFRRLSDAHPLVDVRLDWVRLGYVLGNTFEGNLDGGRRNIVVDADSRYAIIKENSLSGAPANAIWIDPAATNILSQ